MADELDYVSVARFNMTDQINSCLAPKLQAEFRLMALQNAACFGCWEEQQHGWPSCLCREAEIADGMDCLHQ